MLIPASAASATGDHQTLIGMSEVVDQLAGFGVEEHGAHRNLQDQIFAIAAGAVGAHAVLPALAFVLWVEAEIDQRIVSLAGFEDDTAAVSPVAAGRSAAGNELFPAKGHTSITPVTGFYPNFGFIDKHSLSSV